MIYALKSLCMSALAAAPNLTPAPDWNFGRGAPWLKRLAWYRMPRPFSIPWTLGIRLKVSGKDETLRELFFHGQFEPNEFHYLNQLLKPGMVFIDAGANLGLYSLFASRKVGAGGHVLAIEPSKREFQKLCRNISLNRMKNILALHLAVADIPGTADLRIADELHAGHNSFFAFKWSHTGLETVETVKTRTLDEIVAEHKFNRVDFIKMDIEGAELAALRGAQETLKRFHPTLWIEMAEATENQVQDLLHRCDYQRGSHIGSLVEFISCSNPLAP
jgi:FkbM family methyltransferase